MRGTAYRGSEVSSATSRCRQPPVDYVTARQIEAARIAMTRHIKRGGKVWIRVFPDKPLSKKPLEDSNGKRKGPGRALGVVVKPGRMLYELDGVDEETAREAFRLASSQARDPVPASSSAAWRCCDGYVTPSLRTSSSSTRPANRA